MANEVMPPRVPPANGSPDQLARWVADRAEAFVLGYPLHKDVVEDIVLVCTRPDIEHIKQERDAEWQRLLMPMARPTTGPELVTRVLRILSGKPADSPIPDGYCCQLASETLMLSHDATCAVWRRDR